MDRPPQKREATRPANRKDRIQDLIRQISTGTYQIPAEWVAESILTWRGRSGRRN
jgi:anti-sigma28 factor (negative regulator of flagellin synthesis)